MAANLSNSS